MAESLMYRVYRNLFAFATCRRLEVVTVMRNPRKGETAQGAFLEVPDIPEGDFADPVLSPDLVVVEAGPVEKKEPKIIGSARTFLVLFPEREGHPEPKVVTGLTTQLHHRYHHGLHRERKHREGTGKEERAEPALPTIIFIYNDEKQKPTNRRNERVFLLPYYRFYQNPLEHALGAPAEVLSEAARARHMRERLANRETMRHMSHDDPVAIWLGAEPGQVVRTLVPSEATGLQDECYAVI